MKRFISILTALTMLLTLCTVPAMADAIPGGKYANPLVMENMMPELDDVNSTAVANGNAITITPNQTFTSYSTKNMDYDVYVSPLDWKTTGAVELGLDVTYEGTINAPDFITMNIAMTAFDSSNKRDWIIGAPNAQTDFTFADGGKKNLKWIVEWTDTQLIAKHYDKRPEETSWTHVKTIVKDWQPSADYRKLRDIHIYGQYNFFNGKTEVGSAKVTVENFYMKEIYPSAYLSVPETVLNASTQNADIEYVLNTNYKNAVLTVGGVVAEELNCDTTPAGSYVTTFDLSNLTYTGATPVELTVTDKNGTVTKKTASITTVSPMPRELLAATDFDGNDEGSTLAYTADHVKPNGKTGNGISISSYPEYDAEKFAYNNGGNNAVQLNGVRDLKGYCYDIEFDMYQKHNGSNTISTNGKSGVIVKNWYNNGTANVTGWKTGSWNWIQDHLKIAGVVGKFTTDTWNSMKYTVNTVDSTLTAYDMDTGELLGSTTYVNDGVDYIGLAYAVYNGVNTEVKIDNVKIYRYLPGSKPGVEAVSADALTKTVTVTLDTAFDAAAVDSGVTLKVGESTVAATVAPQADGKTLVITPDMADTLKGKTAVVAIDASVVGSAMEIPVTFPEDYFNRKITENASTNAVTASADVVSYEAGTDAGIMYLAFYKNGNLVEVSKKDLATTTVGVENLSHTYTPAEAYDNIRVFIWDAYKNPLLKK